MDSGETVERDERIVLIKEHGDSVPFEIRDEASAAWVVDKLLGYDETRARIVEQYERALKDIDARRTRFKERFLPQLAEFFPPPVAGKKYKDLTTGRLQWRKVPATVSVLDKTRVAAWLDEHKPDLVEREMVEKITIDTRRFKAAMLARIEDAWQEIPANMSDDEAAIALDEAIDKIIPDGAVYKPETDSFKVVAPKPVRQ